MLIFGGAHLRRIPSSYVAYYNQARTHLTLQKDAPLQRAIQRSGVIVALPSYLDCIINMSGYDFWKRQGIIPALWRRISLRRPVFLSRPIDTLSWLRTGGLRR